MKCYNITVASCNSVRLMWLWWYSFSHTSTERFTRAHRQCISTANVDVLRRQRRLRKHAIVASCAASFLGLVWVHLITVQAFTSPNEITEYIQNQNCDPSVRCQESRTCIAVDITKLWICTVTILDSLIEKEAFSQDRQITRTRCRRRLTGFCWFGLSVGFGTDRLLLVLRNAVGENNKHTDTSVNTRRTRKRPCVWEVDARLALFRASDANRTVDRDAAQWSARASA